MSILVTYFVSLRLNYSTVYEGFPFNFKIQWLPTQRTHLHPTLPVLKHQTCTHEAKKNTQITNICAVASQAMSQVTLP